MTSIETSTDAVAREYERATTDAAWCALAERALLVASGPQRQKFLQGMLSNDVAGRSAGEGCRAALMDVKGHLLAFMRVLVTENEVLLELPADRRETVERLLTHYRVAAPVRFSGSSDVVLGLVGPRVAERLRTLAPELPDLTPESHARIAIAGTSVRLVRAGDLPASGYVLLVPAEHATAVQSALADAGIAPLSRPALDALRIEEGRAWFGTDVTEAHLLHETGLVAEYHSPSKGCYVGQEVVARLTARGANVNQRLRGLRLSEPRPVGTVLRVEGKDVGSITTAAVSPRRGPIAMGYVRRGHAEPGTLLDAEGARAEVAALPLP